MSAGYYDAYYLKALKVRRLIKNEFDEAFSKVDLILTPTAPNTSYKFGEKANDPLAMYLEDICTVPANLAGIPGISIPAGMSSSNLPIGMQLLGPATVSYTHLTDVLAKQGELVQALEALRSANNYDASYIMITNILDESTTLLFSGDVEAVVTKAFEKEVKDNGVFLPNTMSRKKQIVPPILGAMK